MTATDDEPFPIGEYCELDVVAIGTFMAVELALQAKHEILSRTVGPAFADGLTNRLRQQLLHQVI